ncbi:regulator [Streptomyces actinomycinicus]|uniref:Regulator n=1 Tax=Streptomyces actinomycinicus TaxID=1695166 RepID=A0A937JP74_9ACTN|nr:regulator [Streptomyces actinomycinicus]
MQTLEAFADTLIPGQRRFAGDLAVAGAVSGPGAVQAGVIATLTSPELPLAPLLPELAALLNARAVVYATSHLVLLPITVPAFVGLSFRHRTALVQGLFGPEDPDRAIWQVLSLLTGLAFDTAAHLDTRQAVSTGHPGLTWLGFPRPGTDGLWRFTDYSYGRALATPHPATTDSGSPA